MVKTLENLLLQNQESLLVYSIEDSSSTKFVQMMIIGWLLTFYGKVKFAVSIDLYGWGEVEKSFFFNMYLRLMAETENV